MQGISKKCISTIFIVLYLALNLFAQSEGRYSYVISNEKSLLQVFEDLNKKLGLEFSYPSDLLEKYKLPEKAYQADGLNDLIASILSSTDLEFQIVDRRKVLVRPKRAAPIENYTSSNTIIIKGQVKGSSNEALGFVDIVLDTLSIGTSTDDDGNFELEIPKAFRDRKLSFHLIGYATPTIDIPTFLKQPIIKMRTISLEIEELLITEKIPSISIAPIPYKSSIKADYLNNMISPFLSNDIIRGVQMMAGVSATNDASAEVRIRGSQGDETLIMLDGIPIYKADHFYGIFGAVNGNHVNKVDLHKNSMPLQYGGKTGGMLELASSDYINETSGIIDLNMLTSSATISAPLGNKFGFIVSGRTTYDNAADSKLFSWIEPSNEEALLSSNIQTSDRPLLLFTDPVIQFYDWNSKLTFSPNQNHALSFNLFGSKDDYTNVYDIAYENVRTNVTVRAEEDFNDIETSKNFGASLQYKGELANDWSINSSLYHSMYSFSGQLTSSLRITNLSSPLEAVLTNEKQNSVSDFGGFLSLTKKLNQDQFSLGVSAVHHDIAFSFSADNNKRFDTNPTGEEAAIFGTYNWKPDDQFNIALSGRVDYYSATNDFYFGPRIFTSYDIDENLSLKASYSQNYQFLREVTLYTRLREPIDIFLLTSEEGGRRYPVGSSDNLMFGASYTNSKWAADIEFYFKNIDGIIEQTEVILGSNPDENKPAPRGYKTVIGNGDVIGMDLTLGYESKQFESWMAYTLSKATNRFDLLFQGEDIPAPDDRRHQLKWANFYRLGDWSFTGSYVFASGIAQISLLNREEILDITETPEPNTYARLPSYHRVDLGVDYNFKIAGSDASIGIGVFNLTNNQNVDYIQYLFSPLRRRNDQNRSVLTGTTNRLLDRTFNLNFKLLW